MGDLIHDAAVDLFDAGFAVDDDIVEFIHQKADDLTEVGVDGAVAACGLGTADGQKGEASFFGHGFEQTEFCLCQDVLGVPELAGHILRHTAADLVQGLGHFHPQSHRKTDGRVRINGQNACLGLFFREDTYNRSGKGSLADAALSGQCDYTCFFIH